MAQQEPQSHERMKHPRFLHGLYEQRVDIPVYLRQ